MTSPAGPLPVLITAIALLAAAPPGIPVINDDDINVSCYLNHDEGSYLGSVMTFAPEQGAEMCNKTFNACKGKCFACFTDNHSDKVCYDSKGLLNHPAQRSTQ